MKRKRGWIALVCAVVLCAAGGLAGWLWYDSNVDRSGWVDDNGMTGYLDFHGDRVTGWQDIDGQRYCFDNDGVMLTSWQELDGIRCYFGSDGALQTGWQTIEQERYFFGEDGAMAVHWQEIDGIRCFFGDDGTLEEGWLDWEGSRYYLDENGSPVTGPVTLEDGSYYFLEDGTMHTGWAETRYYLPGGTMALGWQEIDENRYFFTEGGERYTGWLEQGEYSYFFHEDGTMAIGPNEIDGKTYYFTPGGIHVWLVNPWSYLHEDYQVELVQVVAGYRIAAVCEDAFNRMMEDCKAAGLNPELISGYRTYWDQQALYMEKTAEYGVASGSQIVAKPNTSEHQLGLAVDIVASGNHTLNKTQGETRVQLWLMEHCWDYGFILRYPEGTTDITGIIYEPWHYRYVGLEVAQELKELGITLEEYLGAVSQK